MFRNKIRWTKHLGPEKVKRLDDKLLLRLHSLRWVFIFFIHSFYVNHSVRSTERAFFVNLVLVEKFDCKFDLTISDS